MAAQFSSGDAVECTSLSTVMQDTYRSQRFTSVMNIFFPIIFMYICSMAPRRFLQCDMQRFLQVQGIRA